MSLFAGFAATGEDRLHRAWMARARRAIAPLGVDGTREWSARGAGLACANLFDGNDDPSLAPLSLDGAVWITADVRLDERDALRRAIQAAGRTVPRRADDTRLLLDGYLAWGDAVLERLSGDFAFALWDGRRRRLLCARDPFGVVPLYTAATRNGLLIANALNPLRLHEDVDDALDERSIADFLLAGFDADPQATAFTGIRQLPPGSRVCWCEGTSELRRYWQPPEWSGFLRYRRPQEYVEHFRSELRNAVADRMRDASVGVQVSGGLDSTSVAAMAHAVACDGTRPVTLRAYTASAGSIMADREGAYASLVTEQLGIPHEIIDIGEFEDVDLFAPPSTPAPLPTQFRRTAMEEGMTRRPSRHGRTVLTGLGGDVLLAYAPSFWLDWTLRGAPRRAGAALRSHWLAFGSIPVPGVRSALRHRAARRAPGAPLPPWLAGDLVDRLGLHARQAAVQRGIREADDSLGLLWAGWPALLTAGHPGATGAALRFRHPFYDQRLLRLALAIPPRPWFQDKHILREATQELLPPAVRARPKVPLPSSVGAALHAQRGMHPQMLELIDAAPALDRFFDREALRQSVRLGAPADRRHARAHLFALGLVYWLTHRSVGRPAHFDVSEPSVSAGDVAAATP